MSGDGLSQPPALLTSWKEIAMYLGKGVRTVQRWEQQFGLPVRRPNEKVKGIVHATTDELDAWLATQWSQRPNTFSSAIVKNGDHIESVRLSIQRSAELRSANHLLVEGMRQTLDCMFEECRLLARNVIDRDPAAK